MEYKNEYYSADNECGSYLSNGEFNNQLDKIKQIDRGYNKIWRNIIKNERIKRTKIDVYTTSGFGNNIRDAETGEYYPYLVQSRDEDLFFSVILATGECRSRNGSNKLFYLSPEKYMRHMQVELDNDIILSWTEKRDKRLRERNEQKSNISSVVVK
jgi:hypothetical protein